VSIIENHLIAAMPTMARRHLLALCESVCLEEGQLLCSAGQPAAHAYFLREGFVVLAVPVKDHGAVQVAMLGREGMLGLHLLWGQSQSPWQAQVQQGGEALRIGARAFRRMSRASQSVQQGLACYQCGLIGRLAIEAGCQHYHALESRLARWLSQAHAHSDQTPIQITQDRLAQWLGVRRVGVTVAIGALQRQGYLQCQRGQITVLDDKGLQSLSCGC
jgi:CRP-like cAMP-binding protein